MQTLVQRDLTTQSYGTEVTAFGGGSMMRRPYGPSLVGWPVGWSAANDTGNNRRLVCKQIAIGNQNSFLISVWYYFSKNEGTFATQLWLPFIAAAGGGYFPAALKLHPDTMVLDLIDISGTHMTNQLAIATIQRRKWINIILAGYRTGVNVAATVRVLLKYRGQAIAQAGTDASCQITTDFFTHAQYGTYGGDGGALQMSARIGLPSIYTLDGTADMVYPSEIIEPEAETARKWYCFTSAAGGGKGYSAIEAFTPGELTTYAAEPMTLMPSELLDASGNVVDATAFDKTALRLGFKAGTYRFGGSAIYLNDTAGPIRFAVPLFVASADYAQLIPDPGLARRVDVRGSTRISVWTLHSGNVYKATFANTYAVVLEYDSASEANSITGKPRWLAHPTAANIAAYLAAATAGSFWTDGTTVYLWPTGSGDPNSNGKVYEVTGGDNLLLISCRGFLMQDLALRDCASADFFVNTADVSAGDCIKCDNDGLVIGNRLDLARGGRHLWAVADGYSAAHLRFVLIDCTANDMRPGLYGVGGSQTIGVFDGTTDGIDNQWSLDHVVCTTTNGVVGSTTGEVDTTNSATLIEHNASAPATAYCFASGEIVNGCVFPGSNVIGSVTATVNIDNSTIGTAGVDQHVSAKNVTITRSRIIGRGLPYIGDGVNPGAGTHTICANEFICSGALGTNPTIIGTATVVGNTIDALLPTGGTTKALWTRGGIVALTFEGNNVLFNSSDAFRLFDTITPASGDLLTMKENGLQSTPADGTRILVTNYAGATKTLAQLVAGGQDVGSVWNIDLKANATYQLGVGSIANNLVNLTDVPSLAGTVDFAGYRRPGSGLTDAGAMGGIGINPARRVSVALGVGV